MNSGNATMKRGAAAGRAPAKGPTKAKPPARGPTKAKPPAKGAARRKPAVRQARKPSARGVILIAAIALLLVGAGIYLAFFRTPGTDYPNPVATIAVRGIGEMRAELYPDIAPVTVANFIDLANEGFYNGLEIYRVIPGVLIQTGDPVGDGTGAADFTIRGEFAANGVKNGLSHTRGVLSMARQSGRDTASSQFFILQGSYPEYDGQYAAFGKVTDAQSLSVLDAIANRGVDSSYAPLNRIYLDSVSVETFGAQYPTVRIGEPTPTPTPAPEAEP